MSAALVATRRLYVSGQLVEIWEDPDRRFGCARADLVGYVDRQDWVLLFNAVALAAGTREPHAGS